MAGILYISCGVPGSGKSTWLKENIAPDEKIISRDEIRFSLLKEGEEYFSHETEVFNIFVKTIAENINSGVNVYADATHLNKASRSKLINALKKTGCKPERVEAISFEVPISVCLERNEKRHGTKAYVQRGQIRRMWASMTTPSESIFSKVWIVDEDGTVLKLERGV